MTRPSDGELCGYVDEEGGVWRARTAFGAVIGLHGGRPEAVAQVLAEGLASLAERWTLRHGPTGAEEVVCIQEVDADAVTVARGWYSLPGVPTLSIRRSQLASGEWELRR